MLYQLPNGKVINISLDDYLNLTDEDIQALVALNYGEYATSYWYKSCIDTGDIPPEEVRDELNLMSYEDEDDYVDRLSNIDINSIPDEDSDFTDQ